jgi:hypothetical protein
MPLHSPMHVTRVTYLYLVIYFERYFIETSGMKDAKIKNRENGLNGDANTPVSDFGFECNKFNKDLEACIKVSGRQGGL